MTEHELKTRIKNIVLEKSTITYESFTLIAGETNGCVYIIFYLILTDAMGYKITIDNSQKPAQSYIEVFFGLSSTLEAWS